MNEATDNLTEATEVTETATNTAGITVSPDLLKAKEALQAIKRKHFSSTALEDGQKYIGEVMQVCDANSIDPVFNFDIEQEFPEGYGLAVIPLTKQVAGFGNVTQGIAIAAVPDYDTVAANPDGVLWIQKQTNAAMLRQIATAAKAETGQITSIPFKVADFATTARSTGLLAFNHLATAYVKALKTKGLKLMSKALLRQILASAAFAEQQYPRLPQSNWVAVINSMVKHAEKDGIDTTGLHDWLKTRDVETVKLTDVDLSDIDALV